jgi:L-methionine (R)-S-oxide reductase
VADIEAWLREFVGKHEGVAGTVHRREGAELILAASLNIPPPVLAVVQSIPEGKGMAGLAWERNAPVSTCNLKTDETGDVRPGAKAVDAKAAVALPIHDGNGEVRGVVGIAFLDAHELEMGELERFATEAETAPVVQAGA